LRLPSAIHLVGHSCQHGFYLADVAINDFKYFCYIKGEGLAESIGEVGAGFGWAIKVITAAVVVKVTPAES